MFYRQCRLERTENGSTHQLMSWLPENHKGTKIKPGVECRLDDKLWWRVVSVGERRIDEKKAQKRARFWQKYKAQTDI